MLNLLLETSAETTGKTTNGAGSWWIYVVLLVLVNSVNERDLSLLTSYAEASSVASFLEGLWPFRPRKFEAITGL